MSQEQWEKKGRKSGWLSITGLGRKDSPTEEGGPRVGGSSILLGKRKAIFPEQGETVLWWQNKRRRSLGVIRYEMGDEFSLPDLPLSRRARGSERIETARWGDKIRLVFALEWEEKGKAAACRGGWGRLKKKRAARREE